MPNPLHDALIAPLQGQARDLLLPAQGPAVTAGAFHDLAGRIAGVLVRAGVVPGDRVAAQVAKSPAALALYAACLRIGAVFLPLNPAYTAAEVGYFITDAEPRVLVCDPSAAGLNGLAAVLTLDAGGQGSLIGDAAPPPVVDRRDDDLAAILYTSGTTGRSKGAMLTHRNLLSNAKALAGLWQFTGNDVLLHALPIFHTHGLFVASNVSLLTGGRMIFLPGFDAATVLRLLPQATVMMGVPTFYTRLLAHPGLTRDAVAQMRLFISGSAPLLAETHTAFRERTGFSVLERYGMTETNMITSNPIGGERAGSVGLPLPGVEVRIDGGPIGGIELRGPNVFAGYWRMPEKTAAEFTPDGWFRTGDLGRFDKDGYLSIVGRAKDLVISGGFNVYPVEVETELDAQPGVLESAVIGLPHADFGEAVFAVLVARPGVTLDAGVVLAGLQDRLARFKQPKAAVVVDALPRNAMGKVQKAELRRTYSSWFSDGPSS